jgi:hypothetical protein
LKNFFKSNPYAVLLSVDRWASLYRIK